VSANFFATDSPFLVRDAYELMNLTHEESGTARMLEWRPGSSDRTTKARLLRAGRARLFGIEGAPLLMARGKKSRRPTSRGSSRDLPIQRDSPGRSSQSPGGLQCTSYETHKEWNETSKSRRSFGGESAFGSRFQPNHVLHRVWWGV